VIDSLLAFVVFATREGLVGERTANGHVIADRDWFAALPSRRGLDTTVKACTVNAGLTRCVFVPVWDVGPWNTHDDYWNADRQMWTDLPQGLPQAQAAFVDGYNGGKDEFGRSVRNPAGVDLGDGAFWDGLGLKDNAWLQVTYLPGSPASASTVVNLRSAPSIDAPIVGGVGSQAQIPVECQVSGDLINGVDRWDRLGDGLYLSHAYVRVPDGWSAPICPE
jgi:hypothetical protein